MTFYVLVGFAGVREDTFVFGKSDQEEYLFAGATLAKGKWLPNQIFWNQYYVMTSNQGIGVRKNRVAFVQDGHEVFVANAGPPEKTRGYYNRSFGWTIAEKFMSTEPYWWSNWRNMVADLEAGCLQGDVQEILSVVREWEKTSLQTALWVDETMRSQSSPRDKTEMFVAYHQWLWHNITRKIVTMGYEKNIWGSIPFNSGGKILSYGALPVCNGWLVAASHRDRYLLSWNGHNIEARTLIFPYGEWEEHGKWRLWKHDMAVLTPQNQLVAFPAEFEFKKESWDWLVFSHLDQSTRLMLVNRRGELCELDLSEYKSKCFEALPRPCVFLGKRKVLISHYDDWMEHLLSIASINPAAGAIQKPRPLWQARIVSSRSEHPDCVVIKDGTTDIFVVMLEVGEQDTGLCFISEHGQFWCPSVLFGDSTLLPYAKVYGAEKNHMAVVAPRQRRSGSKNAKAIVRVLDGQGYVQFNSGIAVSGMLVPFPKRKFDLWAYMNSLLDSGDAQNSDACC